MFTLTAFATFLVAYDFPLPVSGFRPSSFDPNASKCDSLAVITIADALVTPVHLGRQGLVPAEQNACVPRFLP